MLDLDAIRRNSRIHLDREGRFHHAGEPVEHAGVHRALCRGLSVRDDGETIISLGTQWCYVGVEETAQFVTAVHPLDSMAPHPSAWRLDLLNGVSEVLDPRSLFHVGDVDLYCRTGERGTVTRFLRPAYHRLAEHFEPMPEGGGLGVGLGEGIARIQTELSYPRQEAVNAGN